MADYEDDSKPSTDAQDDIVKEACEAFKECEEREADNRKDALDDLKFAKLLEQWPEGVRKSREDDGRPCLTIDRLNPVIRQVVNDARQNKPSIVVHPVDSGADPETAEVFNGLIRHIEQSSNAEVAYDTALDFAATCGLGYFRINTAYASDDTFDQDIVIERVANPFSIYGDPYSTAADSSDWNTAFVVDSLPKASFEKRWKGADAVDWKMGDYSNLSHPWMDGDQVMVAEFWKRESAERMIALLAETPSEDEQVAIGRQIAIQELGITGPIIDLEIYKKNKDLFDALGWSIQGQPRAVNSHKVVQRIMTGAEVLETIEWAGKYIPIVPVYGDDVWVDGKRHLSGIVRAAKDPQRNLNYWRTTATELVALAPKAPWVGPKGAFEADAAKWATANTENHAYIEYNVVAGATPPQRQAFAGVPAGALQEALNAGDDIKAVTGIHDASLGARSNETSGRAIMARQREGDVSTFHYIDNLSRAIRHAGRIILDLTPKVYGTARVLRIIGPDQKPQMKPVNQPVVEEVKDESGQLRKIERIYDLGAGKYDLVVKAGPSFTSRREEAASQMIELIRAYPLAAPVLGDLLAENLDWPGAETIAERLKSLLPPQAQGQNPAVEEAKGQIAQLTQALQQLQAENEQLKQDKANEARKLQVDAFDAETKRMKVVADAMKPVGLTPPGAMFPSAA